MRRLSGARNLFQSADPLVIAASKSVHWRITRRLRPNATTGIRDKSRHTGLGQIKPDLDPMRVRQLYLPDTNILLTRFLSEGGVAEITDYMPIENAEQPSEIIRRVSVIRGDVHFAM